MPRTITVNAVQFSMDPSIPDTATGYATYIVGYATQTSPGTWSFSQVGPQGSQNQTRATITFPGGPVDPAVVWQQIIGLALSQEGLDATQGDKVFNVKGVVLN